MLLFSFAEDLGMQNNEELRISSKGTMACKNGVMENDENSRKLKIGIVGAGIVGATASIALSRLPDVSVTTFERSPGPQETGAWISLTVSGLMVMDKLIDLEEIQRILYRGNDNGTYFRRHWRTGEIISADASSRHVAERFHQARTHRIPLHNVLLSNVPAGITQYSRNIVDHEVAEDGVHLKFNDSSSDIFDLIVAADGIYSKFRRTYVPHEVQYKGAVAYRKVFPETQVAHIKGLPDDSSMWSIGGKIMFLSRLGLGQYGVVAIVRETPEFAATLHWARSTGSEGVRRLRNYFAGWDPLIDEVLQTLADIDAYPLDSAPWLKQLVWHDRIAFVGDAAHPTAGAFGAGATMGQGDCWALFRSLEQSYLPRHNDTTNATRSANHSQHNYDLHRALKLYNETRRHFLGRVELQIALDGKEGAYLAEAGSDEEEWLGRFRERKKSQSWMKEHDVEAEFMKTLAAEELWSLNVDVTNAS